jgi:hypothetical protein
VTHQAPRWPFLTPHRENLRLQRRNSSGSPAGGHTRAFLEYCVQETTAAVGDEMPILFHGPLPLLPLARIHAGRPRRTGSGAIPRASLVLQDAISLASLWLRCRILARCSLGVRSEFKGVFLFVRSLFGVVFLVAISSLRDLDSSSTVKARQAALKIFRAAFFFRGAKNAS